MADTKPFSVTLHRWQGQRTLIGNYHGAPIIRDVTVQGSLKLEAETQAELASMVSIASIDGWSK